MTRATTKIVVIPVDHFSGPRFSRRTWAAKITLRDDEQTKIMCGHVNHPTTDAAAKCGTRLWNALP